MEFIGGFKLLEVDAESNVLVHEGGRLPFDLLALVPPFRAARILSESGLAPDKGWPAVDAFKGFRHARFDDVYIIGDTVIASFGAPMAGFLASHMAAKAAASIASEIKGEELRGPERAYAECFVDHIGDGAAIFCDFTGVIYGEGKPHCHIIAEGPLAGEFKRAFESYWKSSVAPPQ